MQKSNIEWCDSVWNPVTGCSKVSAGCKNCYAETYAKRFWGERKFTDVRRYESKLDEPLRWKRPKRIFVNSMSDLFHEDVPSKFIADVFNTMACATRECRHNNIKYCTEECWTGRPHTFLILTKRPERMLRFINEDIHEIIGNWPGDYAINTAMDAGAWPLPNVWLGVSVEDQKTADERIPLLLQTPAAVRFLSAEPLLSEIDLNINSTPASVRWINGLDWVICGGESGKSARPMHPGWIRSLRDQCKQANVPFFFKQWGEWLPFNQSNENCENMISKNPIIFRDNCSTFFKLGKKKAGRLLDGIEHNKFSGGK